MEATQRLIEEEEQKTNAANKDLEDAQKIIDAMHKMEIENAEKYEKKKQEADLSAAHAKAAEQAKLDAEKNRSPAESNDTALIVILVMSSIVILAMVFYIWKRRANRYKFKKDEIFDEILDTPDQDTGQGNAMYSKINDSFND